MWLQVCDRQASRFRWPCHLSERSELIFEDHTAVREHERMFRELVSQARADHV